MWRGRGRGLIARAYSYDNGNGNGNGYGKGHGGSAGAAHPLRPRHRGDTVLGPEVHKPSYFAGAGTPQVPAHQQAVAVGGGGGGGSRSANVGIENYRVRQCQRWTRANSPPPPQSLPRTHWSQGPRRGRWRQTSPPGSGRSHLATTAHPEPSRGRAMGCVGARSAWGG